MILRRLWVGMQTNYTKNSGTNDKIVLIINDDGVDRLHHTFLKTGQDDQKLAAGNVYEVLVSDTIADYNIDPGKLSNSSVRVAIRGKDLWRPRHFVIWGEYFGGEVTPIASQTNIGPPIKDPGPIFGDHPVIEHSGFNGDLSGDEDEGDISFPLRRVKVPLLPYFPLPGELPEFFKFIIMTTTADVRYAGTSDPVKLTIRFAGEYLVETTITPGGRNKAVFLYTPDGVVLRSAGAPRMTKDNIDSIELRIEGDDAWLPSSFFLLAIAEKAKGILPLVHIPEWDPGVMGWLSTDPNDAAISRPLITLPRALVSDKSNVFSQFLQKWLRWG